MVTVEASGLTSATDEAPPAGDRGVAPSGQEVPITFVKQAPVAHPTKPEASAWTKAVVHSVYTALQIFIPCAWMLRYHRSGMSVWTASWFICSCMLTDSLDFNLRFVVYAWVIVDILVILAWSVLLALVNYINAVVGIGCCLTGAYILFKVWLAEDRLESEHGRYFTISSATI